MRAPAEPGLEGWLSATRAWVEGELDRRLPPAAERPDRLHAAMRYALFGGGKRLRPALCRLSCESLGGSLSSAAAPACALELVHTYSLVHDDLPCMDDDALRRGRPTCHVAFDEATAVLTGDALLTLAFEVLAPEPRSGDLVGVLARAAGSRALVGGQVLDLSLEVLEQEGGRLEDLEDMHARKTGALFQAACEMGALAAGAAEATRRAAADFGATLGRAFQAVDDLLDVTSDAATLGKTPGKDAALARPSLVAALGLEGARQRARELAALARERARDLGWGEGHLAQDLCSFILSRSH